MQLLQKLNCVLLVDDEPADNFFHKRILEKATVTEEVVVAENGEEALSYLTSISMGIPKRPELIFLDINMPAMDGWEFLENYAELPLEQKANIVIIMLTTSPDPQDLRRAQGMSTVHDFRTKPLTLDMLEEIFQHHFPSYIQASSPE